MFSSLLLKYENDIVIGKILIITGKKIQPFTINMLGRDEIFFIEILKKINHEKAYILLYTILEKNPITVFRHFSNGINNLLPKFPNLMNGTFGNIYYDLENQIFSNGSKNFEKARNYFHLEKTNEFISKENANYAYFPSCRNSIFGIIRCLEEIVNNNTINISYAACSLFYFLNVEQDITTIEESYPEFMFLYKSLIKKIILSYDPNNCHINAEHIISNNIHHVLENVVLSNEIFYKTNNNIVVFESNVYIYDNRYVSSNEEIIEKIKIHHLADLKPLTFI